MTNWPRFDWTAEALITLLATADELEVGIGKVGMPLRVAITGAGRSLALDAVHAMGQTRSIERINKAPGLLAGARKPAVISV